MRCSYGSLAFPIVLTTKKALVVFKTVVKSRNTGEEVEAEVTNSETLNSENFFLVLDLMHEYYVISLSEFSTF